MKKILSLTLQILGGVFALLLLVLAGLALAVNSPTIQQKVLHIATEMLSDKLGTNATIDSVYINLGRQKLEFYGVGIDDQQQRKLFEMEQINDDFGKTDAVVVIGANDVLNPAAREAEGTPIYGMPVLNVDKAPEVIICNFDLKPGYAGVENPLYTREKGVYLELGDAKETLKKLIKGIH